MPKKTRAVVARELAREKIGARKVVQAERDRANTEDLAHFFQLAPRILDHEAAIEELTCQQGGRLQAMQARGHTIADIADDTGLSVGEVRRLIKHAAGYTTR